MSREVETRLAGARADALEAEALVGAPLVRIGQHRVRLRRLLELVLGGGVVGIAIRVVLQRERAIRLLQRRRRRPSARRPGLRSSRASPRAGNLGGAGAEARRRRPSCGCRARRGPGEQWSWMQDGTAIEDAADPAPSRSARGVRSRLRSSRGSLPRRRSRVAVLELWYPIHQRFVPKQFSVVEPGRIYRSGQISASIDPRNARALRDPDGGRAAGLRRARSEPRCASARRSEALGIRELHFPLRGDGSGEIRSYASALAEMARADRDGTPVLGALRGGDGANRGRASGSIGCSCSVGPASEAYEELRARRLGARATTRSCSCT